MDGTINGSWLKSDTARKKCFSSWSTTYFNHDHSQSEALLEWNGKVLDETSKFSVQDFILSQDNLSETMVMMGGETDIEAGRNGGTKNDVQLNLSQNNRDKYSSTWEPAQQYGQSQEPYEYQRIDRQPNAAGSATSTENLDSPQKDKKGLKKSKFNGWNNVRARNHFIAKVFAIVMTLLIYNLGIMCLFIFITPVKLFAKRYYWGFYIFFGCFLIFALVLGCCPSVSRKSPINYIMLFFASTFLGTGMGWVSASYEIIEVLMAVGITIAIVLFLALIAIFSPCDFTILIGVVVVIFLCLAAFGIMMIFMYSRVMHVVYCSIGILVISLTIVIDIQMICGGKNRRYQYSEKDYALAALSLYVDITFLLMMVLGLSGAAQG